jgi:hypothetical protein
VGSPQASAFTPASYQPHPGPVTEAVAALSRQPSGGGLLSGSRKLLAGLAVVALVLVGAIVRTIWFSSSASSSSAASPGGGGAAGPATSTSGGAGIDAPGSGASGSGASGSVPATPTGAGTTRASTGRSTGATDGPGGVIAAVGLVQADEAVLAATTPMVSVALVNTLAVYAGGINTKDLTTAYTAYSPAQQAKSPFATWSKGVQDSRLSGVRIVSASGAVRGLASGPVVIDVTFVSHQPGSAGPVPGQTCTVWSLEYTMVPNADATGYVIDSARPSSGTGHAAC